MHKDLYTRMIVTALVLIFNFSFSAAEVVKIRDLPYINYPAFLIFNISCNYSKIIKTETNTDLIVLIKLQAYS